MDSTLQSVQDDIKEVKYLLSKPDDNNMLIIHVKLVSVINKLDILMEEEQFNEVHSTSYKSIPEDLETR